MKLTVYDDDGFIAIVNNANYQGFVDEDWQFDQLMTHFINQMNIGNIIVWQASNDGGGTWLISFQEEPSNIRSFREFEQLINVTTGKLFLTNYSDLTMAAQFADAFIPAVQNADLNIELENGWYKLTVRQLVDPDYNSEHLDQSDEDISFEIIITPSVESIRQKTNNVYWHES